MAEVPPRQQVNGSDSVRMDAADGLPHYSDPADTPGPDVGFGPASVGGFVAVRGQNASGDAYAILKVFQDYMEAERQRAQRRTVVLAGTFAVVLAIVIVGFFVMWFSTVRGMQGTQSALIAAALSGSRQTAAPRDDVEAAVAAAVEKAQAERIAAAQAAAAQAAAADKAAADKAEQQSAAFAEALAKMNETLEAVRKDNESLRASLREREAAEEKRAAQAKAWASSVRSPAARRPAAVPAPAAASSPAAAPAAPAPAQHAAEVRTVAPEIKIKPPAAPRGFKAASMPVSAGGNADAEVNWHYYMPSDVR